MGQKRNARKIYASAAMVVVSAVLLIGLTFAWFTDSVTNKGNKIQAGTLGITATVAGVDQNATQGYAITGVNGDKSFGFGEAKSLEAEGVHVISEDKWEPGQSNAKLLTVTNDGNLAAKVKLQFDVQDAGLQGALWFDFVQVKDGQVQGAFQKRPMSQLATIAEGLELPVAAGGSVQFILVYGMDETAGNEYQGKSFTADATVLATQDTVEKDGFGSDQYDANATMPELVSTSEELVAAAAKGGTVVLESDITSTDNIVFNADASLDMNGKTLDLNNGSGKIEVAKGSSLTISGSGTVNGRLYANRNAVLTVNAGEAFSVKSTSFNTVYAGLNAVVSINGGTYTSTAKEDAVYILGSKLIMNNATVVVEANTVINAKAIHSNASYTELNNVTARGAYSTALNLNNEYGRAVVRGGAFVTDKQSDSNFAAPTISYKGALDISDASITRIRNGIEYSKFGAGSVENLTYNNLKFLQAEGAQGKDIDYKR